ncbi:hypothetical protein JOB18_001468 [Solea senegalensis]|uniref:Uncharacterized protein n=1 Tax=Solea senegalensis TaxID=28829 RepID=A0AAV6QDU3_SOLSE|nr:hypothetical protein JOB18_001468 [Solea senegalensis]
MNWVNIRFTNVSISQFLAIVDSFNENKKKIEEPTVIITDNHFIFLVKVKKRPPAAAAAAAVVLTFEKWPQLLLQTNSKESFYSRGVKLVARGPHAAHLMSCYNENMAHDLTFF